MRNALAVAALLVICVVCGGCGVGPPVGCKADAQCGQGAVCLTSRACAPKCTNTTSCSTEEKCSTAGGCVPKGGCGTDSECSSGQVCEGVSCVASCATASCAQGRTCQFNGHCSDPAGTVGPVGPSCGGELFQATRVQANFLIVLDRSGSMEEKLPSGPTKWSLASAAMKSVTASNETSIRFGLSMFPGAAKCSEGANAVPVVDRAAMQVAQALPVTATGSGTPIGAALLLASQRPELTDATRANFVMLVTDGTPTGDENGNLYSDSDRKNTYNSGTGTWNFGNYAVSPLTGWQSGNIDIVPFPRGSKGRSVGAEASGLCIPAGGKAQNVKWAWEFIKFMTTEPGQRLGFKQGIASIPNSRALATELVPTYRLPHNSRIILELLPQATLPFWCQAISDTELEDVLVNAPYPNAPELEDLYKGRATAAQAMPRVNRRVQALLTADQGLARTFGTKLHL